MCYTDLAEMKGNGAVAFNSRADLCYGTTAPAVWANAPRLRLSNVGTQREFYMLSVKELKALYQLGLPGAFLNACECGCGLSAEEGKRFVKGHKSAEHKAKLAATLTERNHSMVWTDQMRQKISQSNSGRIMHRTAAYGVEQSLRQKEYYQTHTHHKKGKPHSEVHKARIADALRGKPLTEERKENISKATIGRRPWNWTGSDRGYPLGAWKSARKAALERDGHVCMLDPTHKFARYKNPDVHHVNGNKRVCEPYNLICLCKKCHAKMQGNLSVSIPRLRGILTERYGYVYD